MSVPEHRIVSAIPQGSALARNLVLDTRLQLAEVRSDGYIGRYQNLTVIVTLELKSDGDVWIHASVSRRSRAMPKYEDLRTLKELAFGPERTAVQIFPPAHKHIDMMGAGGAGVYEVLHLWGKLDENEWLPEMPVDGTL